MSIRCPGCAEEFPPSGFYVDRARESGLSIYCKTCRKARSADYLVRLRAAGRTTWTATARGSRIFKAYGLTLQEYDELMALGCSICGATERRMCMDHCHESGNNREQLCANCNMALGLIGDNPDVARGMADYLEHHAARNVVE